MGWARPSSLSFFQLSLDDFQLQPPVTFRLKSGSGPVRITGRHQIGESLLLCLVGSAIEFLFPTTALYTPAPSYPYLLVELPYRLCVMYPPLFVLLKPTSCMKPVSASPPALTWSSLALCHLSFSI